MAGSFTYRPTAVSLLQPLIVPVVFRYWPDETDPESRYEYLPHIQFLGADFYEGARPPSARFRYRFGDPWAEPEEPQRFEEVLPLDAASSYAILNDDRLVVRLYAPDGRSALLFDGFAQVPQLDVAGGQGDQGGQEVVTFEALGTPVREWDTPLVGAVMRNADDPFEPDDLLCTGARARFNPDGIGNATPDGADANPSEVAPYPTFLDPLVDVGIGGRRKWTLGMAARYICFVGNPDERYVKFYVAADYDAILESRRPYPRDDGAIDPDDPDTFRDDPIEVNDLGVSGDPWPAALEKLIGPHGFGFRFYLTEGPDGDPEWWMRIYRKDDQIPLKTLYLQSPDDLLVNPARSSLAEVRLQRDASAVINEFVSDAEPTRYEGGFVLAPGFPVDPTDAAAENLARWQIGQPNYRPGFYRDWVFDECGLGHWDFTAGEMATTATSLDDVFDETAAAREIEGEPEPEPDEEEPPPADGEEEGQPPDRKIPHVKRSRPALSHLFTKDADGQPLPARLYVSTDYAGPSPGVWDGSGTWQEVTRAGWSLLEDRLGIRLTRTNLENWIISDPVGPEFPFPSGVIRVITSTANPNAQGERTTPRFRFLLVAAIEGDQCFEAIAPRRKASPTHYTVRRHAEHRSWFGRHVIAVSSKTARDAAPAPDPDAVGPPAPARPRIVRDDQAMAQAQVRALRRAHELGTISGSVTIRRVTFSYEIGDRVNMIRGRDCSLRQNLGTTVGEADTYPCIVGITWSFDNEIVTRLHLNDRRAEPPPERRR